MAHFLCHLECSHFGALLLDFYFTENILHGNAKFFVNLMTLDIVNIVALNLVSKL